MSVPSKEELIRKYFHEFHGMVCEALTWSSRDAADLSRTMNRNSERIKALVRQMVDEIYPPSVGDSKPASKPPANSPPRSNPPGAR